MANGETGHPYLDSLIDASIAAVSAFSAVLGGLIFNAAQTQTPLTLEPALLACGGGALAAFIGSIKAARERTKKFHRKKSLH